MREIDVENLTTEELRALSQTLFLMLGTYADLHQRLQDTIQVQSNDNMPTMLEAWFDALEKVETAFEEGMARYFTGEKAVN